MAWRDVAGRRQVADDRRGGGTVLVQMLFFRQALDNHFLTMSG